jgi:flagellar basal body-associated protein FliL
MPKKSEDSKKKSKLPMIVGAAILGIVAYKFVLAPPAPAEPAAAEGETAAIEEGAVVPLPELVLNLADHEPRYLRVGIALILEAGVSIEKVEEELPIASDVAVDLLSSKTYAELREPGAKQLIKEELSKQVREAFHDEKVVRVLFTSFVMQ